MSNRLYITILLLVLLSVGAWKTLDHHNESISQRARFELSADQRRRIEKVESHPFSIKEVQRIQQWQKENFLLMRSPIEPLPASLRRSLHKPSLGANWNLAHVARRSGSLWLVPGRGFLCLIWARAHTSYQSCVPRPIAIRYGVAITTIATPRGRPDGRTVIGIAPDGAKHVLVHTGASVNIGRVSHGGVFVVRDSASYPPDILTFK